MQLILLKYSAPWKGILMSLGDEWPDLLTVREVAKILRVSPLTIKRWASFLLSASIHEEIGATRKRQSSGSWDYSKKARYRLVSAIRAPTVYS
jgi:hypothetical protein